MHPNRIQPIDHDYHDSYLILVQHHPWLENINRALKSKVRCTYLLTDHRLSLMGLSNLPRSIIHWCGRQNEP